MTKKDKTSRSGPKGFWIPITNTRAMDALKTMAALEFRTINEQAAMLVLQTLIDRGFLKGPVDVQGNPVLLSDKDGNDPEHVETLTEVEGRGKPYLWGETERG